MHRAPRQIVIAVALFALACSGNRGGAPQSGGGKSGASSDPDSASVGDRSSDAAALQSGLLFDIKDIAYGAGHFVAVGEFDNTLTTEVTGFIFTSTDGDTWTRAVTDPPVFFTDVEYGNGLFLIEAYDMREIDVVPRPSYVVRSADGETFDAPELLEHSAGYGNMTFGRGLFVLAGGSSGLLWSTADGKVFEQHSAPSSGSGIVAFGADRFAFLSDQLYLADTLDAWTTVDVRGTYTAFAPYDVRGVGDALVVQLSYDCCYGEMPTDKLRASSRDGTAWRFATAGTDLMPAPEFLSAEGCISLVPTTFDTAPGADIPCSVVTPSDLTTGWGSQAATRASGGGTYVVGGEGGIMTSHDGKTWRQTLFRQVP